MLCSFVALHLRRNEGGGRRQRLFGCARRPCSLPAARAHLEQRPPVPENSVPVPTHEPRGHGAAHKPLHVKVLGKAGLFDCSCETYRILPCSSRSLSKPPSSKAHVCSRPHVLGLTMVTSQRLACSLSIKLNGSLESRVHIIFLASSVLLTQALCYLLTLLYTRLSRHSHFNTEFRES